MLELPRNHQLKRSQKKSNPQKLAGYTKIYLFHKGLIIQTIQFE